MLTSFLFVAAIPSNTVSKEFITVLVYSLFVLFVLTTDSIDIPQFLKFSVNSAIIFVIFPSYSDVFSASSLIFEATTANPFPASPALAASILALRLKRLVLSAIA